MARWQDRQSYYGQHLWDTAKPWDQQHIVKWATECRNKRELLDRIEQETGHRPRAHDLVRALTQAREIGLAIPDIRLLWKSRDTEAPPPGPETSQAEVKLARARVHIDEQTQRIKSLQRELARLEGVVDAHEAIAQADEIKIRPPKKRKKSLRGGVPIIMASDWHVEEVVEACRVNGVNEYDPDIAKQRAERFFQGAAAKVQQARGVYDCRDVVLWLGGDFVTGFIHETYQQTNAMTPTQATRYFKGLIMAGVDMLLNELPDSRLSVVCSYGNHGRTTIKPVDSGVAAANSFEYAAYMDMAERYEKTSRVTWRIAESALEYVQIYDWTLRFTHGDKGVRYRDAIGGISTACRKAIMGWDTSRRADYTIMGHWHQWLTPFSDVIVNGSLIGYNPFAVDIKARWEPPQQGFWILDEERGRRHTESIWVSHYGARRPKPAEDAP